MAPWLYLEKQEWKSLELLFAHPLPAHFLPKEVD